MDNRIEIGGSSFRGERLPEGSYYIGNSLACDELGVDTLEATVDGSAVYPTLFQPADADGLLTSEDELFGVRPYYRLLVDDLTLYRYGEPVSYYRGEALVGKFYMSSVKRAGKYTYAITCTSAIGLLDGYTHYGGIYAGQKVSQVLADIVGGVVSYRLDDALANVPVYGWLPVATRRANLHQLLFALGASVKKDTAGMLEITTLSAESPTVLPDSRQFTGGSVDYPAYATRAEVTEHSYLSYSGDERVTLFEGDVSAEALTSPRGAAFTGTLVTFDSPIHDLQVENSAVLESGVNYAVLGPGLNCKLTGQKYAHTTRIVTAEKKEKTRALAELQDKTVRVTEATLVSLANSENVAQRVLAYYGSARTIQTDIVVGTERPGDAVSLTDPFGEPAVGLVKSMDVTVSGLLRASVEIVEGYVPTGSGNFYERSVTLTADGAWTVPEGVTKIRLTLIGGGQGGYSGAAGEGGTNGQIESKTSSVYNASTTSKEHEKGFCGDGGEEGSGGHGGKVYLTDVEVTPGQVLYFTIGKGGAGGARSGSTAAHNPGAEGTATVCGEYSSDNGAYSPYGYSNIFTGEVLAQSGGKGVRGGRGAGDKKGNQEYLSGPTVTLDGVIYRQGADAYDRGDTKEYEWGNGAGAGGPRDRLAAASYGGDGGGPAAGADGSIGGGSTVEVGRYYAKASIGRGGSGATPTVVPPVPKIPGSGGHGGHGGGGGGAPGYGGASYKRYTASTGVSGSISVNSDSGGSSGGAGGSGGNGAPGCVIIYY